MGTTNSASVRGYRVPRRHSIPKVLLRILLIAVAATPIALLAEFLLEQLGLSSLSVLAITGSAFGLSAFAARRVRWSRWRHDLWCAFGIAGLISGDELGEAEYGAVPALLITVGFALGVLVVLFILVPPARRPTP